MANDECHMASTMALIIAVITSAFFAIVVGAYFLLQLIWQLLLSYGE